MLPGGTLFLIVTCTVILVNAYYKKLYHSFKNEYNGNEI